MFNITSRYLGHELQINPTCAALHGQDLRPWTAKRNFRLRTLKFYDSNGIFVGKTKDLAKANVTTKFADNRSFTMRQTCDLRYEVAMNGRKYNWHYNNGTHNGIEDWEWVLDDTEGRILAIAFEKDKPWGLYIDPDWRVRGRFEIVIASALVVFLREGSVSDDEAEQTEEAEEVEETDNVSGWVEDFFRWADPGMGI